MRPPLPPLSALAVVFAASVISPPAARAQSPGDSPAFRGQVVVLKPAEVDEVMRTALARVTGELTAARFQVSIVGLDPTKDPTPQVETVAPELSPVAAFAIVRPPNSTDDAISIWVSDRTGQRTTIQHVKLRGTNVSQEAEALAVDAIELIRVSVAGLWPAPAHAGEGESTAATKPAAVATREEPAPESPRLYAREREFSLGIGVGGLQDIGLTPTQWLGAVDAMFKWPIGFALRAQVRGLGPATSIEGDSPTATAHVHREIYTAGAAWVFWSDERVQSLVGLSLGASRLSADGSSSDSTLERSQDAWSFVGSVGLGASLRLGQHLALALEVDALLALPPLNLRVGTNDTASFSSPGILTSALLQARF